jgi:hypothetical protein
LVEPNKAIFPAQGKLRRVTRLDRQHRSMMGSEQGKPRLLGID